MHSTILFSNAQINLAAYKKKEIILQKNIKNLAITRFL